MRTNIVDHVDSAAEIDFARIVPNGGTVLWSSGVGEPLPLIEELLAQRHRIGRFTVLYAGAGYAELVRPEHADVIRFITLGAVGSNRALTDAGVAEVLPCHLSDLPDLITSGILPVDVVLAQLSSDADGHLSFGATNGYVESALAASEHVVAEINDCAPWTHARHPMRCQKIDVAFRTSRSLIEVHERATTETDLAIAHRVADLVPDGATIQLGIGGVPNAVAALLADRRRLGVHSGVIGDAVVDLIESGAVTNEHKATDRGISVTGGLVGTHRLLDFANANPDLRLEPVSYTHAHDTLQRLPAFHAINSALEVDVTGQVGSEVAGSRYVGTIGGQVDFVRGAVSSSGGHSIIALPARTASSQRARITSRISSGVITTARSDADIFVTEFGVAQLRGATISERVRRMIAIAHPDDRDDLLRQARTEIASNS